MFRKLGLLPLPTVRPSWMHSHAYIPTAFLLNPTTIRILVAFWDVRGVGRIGYLDAAVADPLRLIGFSEQAALDIGDPGTFDDNGVSPLCIVTGQNCLQMYYAGWQLSDKVRYLLFTGIATSKDDGATFERVQQTPILERSAGELTVRTGGFIFGNAAGRRMIYCGGSCTIDIAHKQVPTYDLRYLESPDGIHWPGEGTLVFSPDRSRGEFGFGRPFIASEQGIWKMWYGVRTIAHGYHMGYAESEDGQHWLRMDESMHSFNNDDFAHDNQMRAFPSILQTSAGSYLFYNGNDYGKEGLCVARRDSLAVSTCD